MMTFGDRVDISFYWPLFDPSLLVAFHIKVCLYFFVGISFVVWRHYTWMNEIANFLGAAKNPPTSAPPNSCRRRERSSGKLNCTSTYNYVLLSSSIVGFFSQSGVLLCSIHSPLIRSNLQFFKQRKYFTEEDTVTRHYFIAWSFTIFDPSFVFIFST